MSRRVAAVLALLVVATSVVAAVAPAAATDEPGRDVPDAGRPAATDGAPSPATGVAAGTGVTDSASASGAAGEEIVETRRLYPTFETDGSVEVGYTYDVYGASRLRIRFPGLGAGRLELVSTDGFAVENGTVLAWDGSTRNPSFRVRVPTGTERMDGRSSVEREDWAFVTFPTRFYRYWYRGDEPAFRTEPAVAGEGFAVEDFAYAGPGERYRRETAFGTSVSVFVPAAAEPVADPRDLLLSAVILVEDFQVGLEYDETAMFVLPRERTPADLAGEAVGASYWVADDSARLDTVATTVTHEFAHTRVGAFGDGSAAWLTEGFATYYEYTLALNQGMGSFEAFRTVLRRARERYAPDGDPAVLTEPSSWEESGANYGKGALVLAALDARIRNRTDGEHTLQDVLAVRYRDGDDYGGLGTYADFRRAVVGVTGEPSLGAWLDRYATTEAVPPVPENPYRFVTREVADPDEDGLEHARERTLRTNPFRADTDGDGIDDGTEAAGPTDPTVADTDDDGLADGVEVDGPTNATRPDTDGDGVPDGADAFPTDASRATATPTATPERAPDGATATSEAEAAYEDEGDSLAVGPGFGPLVALLAVALAVFVVVARRE